MNETQKQGSEEVSYNLRRVFKIKPGTTIYTRVSHVSRSGMSRRVNVYVIKDGAVANIGKLVNLLLGHKRTNGWSVVMQGCGTDMCFEVVYLMGRVMWPNGFTCAGKKCRSNDHSNGDTNYNRHRHSDGGYALIKASL